VVQRTPADWQQTLAALSPDQDASSLLEAFFEAERLSLRGAADFAPALAAFLEEYGSKATVEEALSLWTHIEPVEEVLDLFPGITVPVGLASNQQSHRAQYMRHQLNYNDRFHNLFLSCDLGFCKPDKEYFLAIISHLRMEPETLLFIDDHQSNVDAARASGLQAERFHVDEGIEILKGILKRYGTIGSRAHIAES
jgi:putative hydrolase of the HAD superfamily